MYNEISKLSDPRPTWNSAPMSGNAVATSNQFKVSAITPRLMTASIPHRIGPSSSPGAEATVIPLSGVLLEVDQGCRDLGSKGP